MVEEPIPISTEMTPGAADEISAQWTPLQTASLIVITVLCLVLVWNAYHPQDVYLSDLDFDTLTADRAAPQRDQSVSSHTIQINDVQYGKGVSVSAQSEINLRLIPEGYSYFVADIGVDANAPEDTGSVVFSVISGGTMLYQSQVLKKGMAPLHICIPVRTNLSKSLTLKVTDADDGNAGDFANWAEARFVYSL